MSSSFNYTALMKSFHVLRRAQTTEGGEEGNGLRLGIHRLQQRQCEADYKWEEQKGIPAGRRWLVCEENEYTKPQKQDIFIKSRDGSLLK